MLQVRRRRDNLCVILGLEEAMVVRSLPERLRALLEEPDFSDRVTKRLFPSAYRDQKEEQEYRKLLGDDLIRRKLQGVEAFEKTLRDCRIRGKRVEITIRPADFDLWLGFVNDTRVMLGTELDIRDDDWGAEFDFDHPRADDLALLHFLTWLEEELIRGSGFRMPEIDPESVRRRGKDRENDTEKDREKDTES